MPTTTKRSGGNSEATKTKIVAAALACLGEEGIAGASARAIARHGDFNQALIFYHFGSVDGLLVAASQTESRERSERYAARLGEVTTLPELVAVARELHDAEVADGSTAMLVQLMAGAARSDELREGVFEGLSPWMDLVEDTVNRVIGDTPLAHVGSVGDLSMAIAALFLGMELIGGLSPDTHRADSLFSSLATLGTLVEAIMQIIPPGLIEPTTAP